MTVQSLGVLTTAPCEARSADAHVTAALRVLALAPILQGSPPYSPESDHKRAVPPPLPDEPATVESGGQVWLVEAPGRAGPGRWDSGRCHVPSG